MIRRHSKGLEFIDDQNYHHMTCFRSIQRQPPTDALLSALFLRSFSLKALKKVRADTGKAMRT